MRYFFPEGTCQDGIIWCQVINKWCVSGKSKVGKDTLRAWDSPNDTFDVIYLACQNTSSPRLMK